MRTERRPNGFRNMEATVNLSKSRESYVFCFIPRDVLDRRKQKIFRKNFKVNSELLISRTLTATD